ncbi:unnamed protein product [Knipowitschia caucasica]
MFLAIEPERRFVFSLKSSQREWEQRKRQWCSSKAEVLRIAATYTQESTVALLSTAGAQRQAHSAIYANVAQVQHERSFHQRKR